MKRIAFAACNKRADRYLLDPSFIYRCMNLAHGVRALGHEVWCGHLSSLPLLQRWDVLVLHRPSASLRVKAVTAWLRRRGVRILADIDDLIMDPRQASWSPGVVNGLVSLSATEKQFALNLQALQSVDGICVSTLPLAEQVQRLLPGLRVQLIPNAVHHTWLEMPPSQPQKKVMTYMPGTRSHDRDFAVVLPVLERVLKRHSDAQLRVTGPVDFALDARPGQVSHQQKKPFAQYHQCFDAASINLAPLEATPFNQCKSALKVLEAAWWNVPTVCSRFPDAMRLEGAGALLADSAQDFEEHLESLLSKPLVLQSYASGLRERMQPFADVMKISRDWQDFALEYVET